MFIPRSTSTSPWGRLKVATGNPGKRAWIDVRDGVDPDGPDYVPVALSIHQVEGVHLGFLAGIVMAHHP